MTIDPTSSHPSVIAQNHSRPGVEAKTAVDSARETNQAELQTAKAITFGSDGNVQSEEAGQNLNVTA